MELCKLPLLPSLAWVLLLTRIALADPISIVLAPNAAPRVEYGASRLANALTAIGSQPTISHDQNNSPRQIFVGNINSPVIKDLIQSNQLTLAPGELKSEGFLLATLRNGAIAVAGADDSGALYGCLELAQRIQASKQLPAQLHFIDAPAFKLRGPCIGMQKTYILPGRHVYEYPYTPELFPFFYDKEFWNHYLDFLVDHRMNTLYLWSGHPFASLVKLDDYPYALEVDEKTYQKNVEMFRYIASEADRRGIWVVQMFYNILVSKPFAEHNGIDTQLSQGTPLVADYTRKSVAQFIKQYPNVGLMFCLGEALKGIDNQVEWCTQVLLPGVKDGMAQAHLTEEPPVIIRTHATDATIVMPAALKVYKNLYTEEKYNGESLTTWQPRGTRAALHVAMSKLGSTHMVNIHILSNLEPFRYGAQRFIKLCVLAARDRLGAKGIHLYPLSYWNWPDSPDIADPPLKQLDRDWIWFDAWSRYAWNPDIDPATDHKYWVGQLDAMYGQGAGENILAAYNDSGECAPRLIRRFGITEGNRQTLSLGMTLDQLVHPERYHAYPDLWESESPPGERMQVYVQREWNHQNHEGETPPQIIREVLDFSKNAVDEIEAAAPAITRNRDEFNRLRNDMYCIQAMSHFYADKANAAMLVLRYDRSKDLADMRHAASDLAASVDDYRALVKLTDHAYRFANGMQTSQRQIPFKGGIDGKPANYLWSQILPKYEKELADFQTTVDQLEHGKSLAVDEASIKPLPKADFTLLSKNTETYDVQIGAHVFTDDPAAIKAIAPDLKGLVGIRISNQLSASGKYDPIEFNCAAPVQILIGYFKSPDPRWLKPPELETNAQAAEHGADLLIQNAVTIENLPPVDVYSQTYAPGHHKLQVPGLGSFIILGVIPQSTPVIQRDAHGGKN